MPTPALFPHRHHEDEVLFLRQGSAWIEVGQRCWLATAPQVLWVGSYLPHSYQYFDHAEHAPEPWILQVPYATWTSLGLELGEDDAPLWLWWYCAILARRETGVLD